jgi:hypothetical protein
VDIFEKKDVPWSNVDETTAVGLGLGKGGGELKMGAVLTK